MKKALALIAALCLILSLAGCTVEVTIDGAPVISGVGTPVTEEAAASDEAPASEEPASEEPASEEPASEEPASEEPAVEEPVIEEPAEEPAADDSAAAGDMPAGWDESQNAGLDAGIYPHFDEYRDYVAGYALADSFMATQAGIPDDIYAAASPYIAPFSDINPVIGAMDYADWMAANYPGESFPTA